MPFGELEATLPLVEHREVGVDPERCPGSSLRARTYASSAPGGVTGLLQLQTTLEARERTVGSSRVRLPAVSVELRRFGRAANGFSLPAGVRRVWWHARLRCRLARPRSWTGQAQESAVTSRSTGAAASGSETGCSGSEGGSAPTRSVRRSKDGASSLNRGLGVSAWPEAEPPDRSLKDRGPQALRSHPTRTACLRVEPSVASVRGSRRVARTVIVSGGGAGCRAPAASGEAAATVPSVGLASQLGQKRSARRWPARR